MADKVYVVTRGMTGANGSGFLDIVGSYATQELADKAKLELEAEFKAMLDGQIMAVGPDGLAPTGLSVGSFLHSLGIENVRYRWFATEPKGAVLVAPPKSLIRLQ